MPNRSLLHFLDEALNKSTGMTDLHSTALDFLNPIIAFMFQEI